LTEGQHPAWYLSRTFVILLTASMPDDSENLRTPGFLARRMHQVSVAIFHETLRELGITPIQQTILRVISREDGLDQISIASRAKLDTSTVRDVLNRLAGKNLIKRERSDQDARMRLTYITDLGRNLLARAEPLTSQASQTLLASLNVEERKQLLSMMSRIVAAHEQVSDSDGHRKPFKRLKMN